MTTPTAGTIRRRVKRGAALFDACYPGWRKRVNLNVLNIGSIPYCVVSQVVTTPGTSYVPGSYVKGLRALGVDGREDHYGFDVDMATEDEAREVVDMLNAAWAREVKRGQSR